MNSSTLPSGDDVTAETEPRSSEASVFRRPIRLRWTMGHPDGIVTGLSSHLAERLGVDPLWIRLAFVGSGLLKGLGLIVYVGLWLALIVARSTPLRVLGWSVIVGGVIVLTRDELNLVTGPVVVIGLLGGLALTLWKPVPIWTDEANAADPRSGASQDDPRVDASAVPDAKIEQAASEPAPGPTEALTGAGETPATGIAKSVRGRRRPRIARPVPVVRIPRRRRVPSVLGRATFGLATIVAATGALIDELNGGRLHPEQWLGAAAVVCGLGLLVGTTRGHTRWLIVPASVFAVVGYGAGVIARIGVPPTAALASAYTWVSPDSSGQYRAYTGFGSAYLTVQGASAAPVTVDVRTANGMQLEWNPEVAVEIRSELGPVTMNRNGVEQTASTFTLGPDGEPDVVVDLRMARGDINVYDTAPYDEEEFASIDEEAIPRLVRPDGSPVGPIADVDDGIAVTADGWIILRSDTILDEFNNVIYGDAYSADDVSLIVSTDIGDYRIVGPVLFSPDGSYYDLDELRNQRLAALRETTPSDQSTPFETVPPASTATNDNVNGLER